MHSAYMTTRRTARLLSSLRLIPRSTQPVPLLPTPSPSSPTSAAFRVPPSSSSFLLQLLEYNRRHDFLRARDLFMRCRSIFPLTEDIADAALVAMSHLSTAQTFNAFQLFLAQSKPTSPRLFHRMMAIVASTDEGDAADDAAAAGGVEGVERLLQLMQREGIAPDATTFYHLARVHVRHGQDAAAYAYALSMSQALRPEGEKASAESAVSPAQFVELFRLFAQHSHAAACALLLEDMRRCGVRLKPWMQNAVDVLGKRQRRAQQPHPTSRKWRSSRLDGPLPLTSPPPPAPSASTFRVGLSQKAPTALPEDIIRSLDEVDGVPPSIEATLAEFVGEHRRLLSAPFDSLPATEAEAQDPSVRALVDELRDYYAQRDATRVLALWQASDTVKRSPLLMNLQLAVLSTAHVGESTEGVEKRTIRLHIELRHALEIAEQLHSTGGRVDPTNAMLLLRALAYLPMPLPSFATSVFPSEPLLSADVVATEAERLFTHCCSVIDPSHSSTLAHLRSLALRALVKHPQSGARALLSLSPADLPTLSPTSLTYLMYHHVHLPVASLQQPYHLFSLLLASSSPPPLLALYVLFCGELLRSQLSKARAIFSATALRYGHPPPAHMTDALILAHRGVDDPAEVDRLLDTVHDVAQWIRSSEGVATAGLPLGRDALEEWGDMRVRRKVRETRQGELGREARVAKDCRVAEMLWLGLRHAMSEAPASAPSLPMLTQLAVLMAPSPMLPSLLTFIRTMLSSPPYAHVFSSETAVLSAVELERQLYQAALLLTSKPSPPSPSSGTSPIFAAFTRFSYAMSVLPPSEHAAFLQHHLMSRVVRCVVYGLAYTHAPREAVDGLHNEVSLGTLDLDPYCHHVLLACAAVHGAEDAASLFYELGMEAWAVAEGGAEDLALEHHQRRGRRRRRQPARLPVLPKGEVDHRLIDGRQLRRHVHPPAQLGSTLGFGPGSTNPFSHTAQHLHVLRLLSLSPSAWASSDVVNPIVDAVFGGEFIEDTALLALIDLSISVGSPSLLLSALSSLTKAPLRKPYSRSYEVLTSGFLRGVRGALSRHWMDVVAELPYFYQAVVDFAFRHYGEKGGLTSPSPSSLLMMFQREVFVLLATVGVEVNDLRPLVRAYTVTTATRRSLVQGGVCALVLKAALLHGHRGRAVATLADVRRWGDRKGSHPLGSVEQRADMEDAVRTRFPIHRKHDALPTVDAVLRRYLHRVKLTQPPPRPSPPSEGSVQEPPAAAAPSAWETLPALDSALWAYRQLLHEPAVHRTVGVDLLSHLFLDLYTAHVKRLRQREAAHRAQPTVPPSSPPPPTPLTVLPSLIERLCEDFTLVLLHHATTRA